MTSALITVASVLGYLALTLVAARWRYRVMRPYTEPLGCTTEFLCRDTWHSASCYRRWGLVDSKAEAVVIALPTGLAWPFIIPAVGAARLVMRLVTGGDRQLPEEMAANIKRLEAENERLRRGQDRAR